MPRQIHTDIEVLAIYKARVCSKLAFGWRTHHYRQVVFCDTHTRESTHKSYKFIPKFVEIYWILRNLCIMHIWNWYRDICSKNIGMIFNYTPFDTSTLFTTYFTGPKYLILSYWWLAPIPSCEDKNTFYEILNKFLQDNLLS